MPRRHRALHGRLPGHRIPAQQALLRRNPIYIHKIFNILDAYAHEHPEEREFLSPAYRLLTSGANVTSRKEFQGHVTVGAVVLHDKTVLHVEHRASGLSLMPGGHLEPEQDRTLQDAVLRELGEETGLTATDVKFLQETPLHIDIHTVEARPDKNEPEHQHIDFRYLLSSNTTALKLQEAEVASAEWRHLKDMQHNDLRMKILQSL